MKPFGNKSAIVLGGSALPALPALPVLRMPTLPGAPPGTYQAASKIGRHLVSSIRSAGLEQLRIGGVLELTRWRTEWDATW